MKILTFGEMMLRLKPPTNERILQKHKILKPHTVERKRM